MRYFPDDEYSKNELKELKAKPWMVAALKMNPGYCSWGPYEDYMWKLGDDEAEEYNEKIKAEHGYDPKQKGGGWTSRVLLDEWKDFNWQLDDYNEVVNFYFEVGRKHEDCEACDSTGHNHQTKIIADNYYKHSSYDNDLTEKGWRSEERRVGKECRSRWEPSHEKKKK